VKPVLLPPNPIERFYRGGARIARFRGLSGWGEMAPEDWVGSAIPVAGEEERGKARLEDGTSVADALRADSEAWLGAEHAAGFGADPGLLVKLLDAGERLPVHWHPDRAFARARLHSCYGKTEAWVIIESEPGAVVYLGWRRDVAPEDLTAWHGSQDVDGMLDALHRFAVRAGDTILVPAGTPHAIGEGVLMVELQEPTDLSVLLEWKGFTDDPTGVGDLGLGPEVALRSASLDAMSSDDLDRLRSPGREARPNVEALFPPEAEAFFRAERITGPANLPAGFSILVVVGGEGRLGGEVTVGKGTTVMVPHAAGDLTLEGSVTAIRCMPPVEAPEGLAQ